MLKAAAWSLGILLWLAPPAPGQDLSEIDGATLAKPDADALRNLSLLIRQFMPESMDPVLSRLNSAVNRAFKSGDDTATWRLMTRLLFTLQGQRWSEGLDVLSSYNLALDRRLAAPGEPLTVSLQPIFTLGRSFSNPYTIRLALSDARGRPAAPAHTIQVTELAPLQHAFPTRGLKDGDYELTYTLLTPAGDTVAEVRRPVSIDRRLDQRLARLQQDLARLPRDAANPKILAALETAEYVHQTFTRARSEYIASTRHRAPPIATRILGLDDTARYAGDPLDLANGLDLAERLLAAALRGRDPFAGLTGDLRLAYRSPIDQTLQPYRLYVPRTPARRLLVTLHGVSGDENTYFGPFTDGRLPQLAEQRGYLIASPNGRGPVGGYIGASRQDVYDVRERALALFGMDPRQVYLTGHSMGAMGAWQIALEKPELWAAIAPVAGAMGVTRRLLEKAPNLLVFLAQGARDRLTVPSMARNVAAFAREALHTFDYREYPDADHFTIGAASLTDVFDFFDRIQPAP